MAFSTLRSLVAQAALLSLAAQSCSAAMDAWWTNMGPQIIRQNVTTGGIMYSMCNSNSTPIFPNDPPLLFSLSYTPKNGTALTGQGWWDSRTTWASIFYQDLQGDIVNAVYECDWPTGRFVSQGSYIISNAAEAPAVNNNTGLASVLLGSTDGYRVFYHDQHTAIHQLSYANNVNNNQWAYSGVVDHDPPYSSAICAQFTSTKNMSVVYPKDQNNIEVSRWNSNNKWQISTFPRPLQGAFNQTNNATNATSTAFSLDYDSSINFTLPAWTGQPKAMGLSIDSAYTRSVFYIGSDRLLHQVANINYAWKLYGNQSNSTWPPADEPGAEFALASDFTSSQVRIYYDVGGNLTEIKYDADGFWKTAAPVQAVNLTAAALAVPTPSSNATSSPSATPDDAGGGGLSSGAKAGIGVGVAVGVLALVGAAVFICCLRRREARLDAQAAAAAEAQRQQEAEREMAQQQQQYYDYAGQPPYGTPPVVQTPYSATTAGGYTSPPFQTTPSPFQQAPWPAEKKVEPEPQELEGPRPMYELPDQQYSHELLGEGHVRELQ